MRGEAFNWNFYYHGTVAFEVLFLVYKIPWYHCSVYLMPCLLALDYEVKN